MEYPQELLYAILRQDFSSFIRKSFYTINPQTEYQPNWHIDLIADYLEAARSGEIRRLIINMPPRALKSVCVSVAWPAWLLGQNPAARIMAASYSSMLSIKHSMDCRLVMSSDWYRETFCDTQLHPRHNQKSKFLTTENGFRFATSVGGSATGEGGDFLIIDDPHNPTQINSRKMRSRAIEWFEQTFATRLNDKSKGVIILVMQRLHEEDLSAHLISSGNWELLKIPALASDDLSFKISGNNYFFSRGEILNKNRDTNEFLVSLENEIGVRNFAAQYLQTPLPTQSYLLAMDDISFWQKLPGKFDYFIQSWDTAIKVSEQSDYSVCTCWGALGNQYYLMSMVRQKMSYPVLKDTALKQAEKYQPRYILIEDKASGQSLIQDLRSSGYNNIKPIRPKLDKITRFASCVPTFQSGQVLLPRQGSMRQELLRELTSFPNVKHDDIVDSVSQFINHVKECGSARSFRMRNL